VVDALIVSRIFGNVSLDEVLRSIDISAESEVVELSNIALVKILSNEKLEELLRWWDQSCLLHDSSELLNRDVAALGLIVIHELGLNQDSLVSDLVSNRSQKLRKSV